MHGINNVKIPQSTFSVAHTSSLIDPLLVYEASITYSAFSVSATISKFRNIAMFRNFDLSTTTHTLFVATFCIYFHFKFNDPSYTALLFVVNKLKSK
jgi:hypothetical protein